MERVISVGYDVYMPKGWRRQGRCKIWVKGKKKYHIARIAGLTTLCGHLYPSVLAVEDPPLAERCKKCTKIYNKRRRCKHE